LISREQHSISNLLLIRELLMLKSIMRFRVGCIDSYTLKYALERRSKR
jgi:hypothetical protein